MKAYFTIIGLFIASSYGFTQGHFLDNYIGKWNGFMIISSNGVNQDTVKTSMEIDSISNGVSIWKTCYGDKNEVVKEYILKEAEDANVFVLDEGDGIELMVYKSSNKLISMFHYEDTHMFTSYELIDNKILFDIYITAYSQKRIVNDSIADYPLISTQKSILIKK